MHVHGIVAMVVWLWGAGVYVVQATILSKASAVDPAVLASSLVLVVPSVLL